MADCNSPSAFLERCGSHIYRGLKGCLLAPAWALHGLFAALVLVNVALIVLVSGGFAGWDGDASAAHVNTAGRQRMVIQDTAKQALFYSLEWQELQQPGGDPERYRQELEAAEAVLHQGIARFRSQHEALLGGDPERGMPALTEAGNRRRLRTIQEQWRAYEKRLRRLLTRPDDHALAEDIMVRARRLHRDMDAAVEALQHQIDAADQRQQYLILALLGGNLVMLPVAGGVAWSYRRRSRDQGRLQSVLAEIPDLVFFKDDQLRYLGANDAFLRFVDRSAEQVVGSTDSDLFDACTANLCQEMDRRLFAEGRPPRCVSWEQYPDGQWVYLDTQQSPLDLGDGRVGVVGIGRDLTATKRAQEVEQRLARIVEEAPDPIGFAEPGDPPQGIFLNPAGRALLGLDAEEAIGNIFRFYPEDAARHQREEVLPQVWERGYWRGETTIRAVDGTEIPVDQILMAHRDDSGAVQVLSTVARDLRPYKQAEEALRQAALREETITNHLVDNLPGIFLLFGAADGRIHRWNHTLETHTGLDGEALQACTPVELVPEADREAFRSAMATVPATGQQSLEAGLLDGAGTAVPFQYHANRLGWDDEDYVCLLGFDIRERVRLEEERQALLETFENLAITDPLTGVANRRRLDEITAEEVERAGDRGDGEVR